MWPTISIYKCLVCLWDVIIPEKFPEYSSPVLAIKKQLQWLKHGAPHWSPFGITYRFKSSIKSKFQFAFLLTILTAAKEKYRTDLWLPTNLIQQWEERTAYQHESLNPGGRNQNSALGAKLGMGLYILKFWGALWELLYVLLNFVLNWNLEHFKPYSGNAPALNNRLIVPLSAPS